MLLGVTVSQTMASQQARWGLPDTVHIRSPLPLPPAALLVLMLCWSCLFTACACTDALLALPCLKYLLCLSFLKMALTWSLSSVWSILRGWKSDEHSPQCGVHIQWTRGEMILPSSFCSYWFAADAGASLAPSFLQKTHYKPANLMNTAQIRFSHPLILCLCLCSAPDPSLLKIGLTLYHWHR